MHYISEICGSDARFFQDAGDGVQESVRGIVRSGRNLANANIAAYFIDQDGVGKGPTNIDAQYMCAFLRH